MTSQSPRIYLYKITFEEVPYYYYGVKKEKYFNQEYLGSPYTHKWVWEFYTPKKQILQIFDYSDECYVEAQEVEKRLIKPVYQTDKWCLNESCGGKISLELQRKNANKNKKLGVGMFCPEKRKQTDLFCKENKIGIHSLTDEERKELGRKSGKYCKENGLGIFAETKEDRSKRTTQTNYQKWMCLETGFITNAGNLSRYQMRRGIDKSRRVRIE
jgi:hypothetical protein